MKSLILLINFLFVTSLTYAQIGIDTDYPSAKLDVNGNLKIRQATEITSLNADQMLLVKDESSSGDHEIKKIKYGNLFNSSEGAIYSKSTQNIEFVSLAIGNFQKISIIDTNHLKVGSSSVFDGTTYTAPSSGLYFIQFTSHLQNGVTVSIFNNRSLAIIRNNVVYDTKLLNSVAVGIPASAIVVQAPVGITTFTSLVQLSAGDQLNFGIETNGLLTANLNILKETSYSVIIHKIP